MNLFRVYRSSTMLTGHRPENELSFLDRRKRIDGKAAVDNWFIAFEDMKAVLDFIEKHGNIIIKKPTYEGTDGDIEIYDVPREALGLDDVIN